MKKRKVVVFGLDGCTWELLRPWVKAGELPVIEGLMKEGVYATLLSTIPSYTLPNWTSLITGVNPGKHGIYDIFYETEDTRRVVRTSDRKVLSLFQLANEYDKTAVAVNIPGTYPPEHIQGAMVSGLMTTPGSESNYVYPETLKNELSPFFKRAFTLERASTISRYLTGDKPGLIKLVNDMLAQEVTATIRLLNLFQPDVFWQVFRTTDLLQHYLYKSKDLTDENNQLLLEHYRAVDTQIQRIMDQYQEKPTVLIVSDHGFAPIKKQLHLNNWLENENLLRVKAIYVPFLRLVRWLVPIILPEKRGNGGEKQRKRSIPGVGVLNELAKKILSPQNFVDFANSKAYCPSMTSQAIKVFAEDESERNELVNTIISGLKSIKDPENGEPVVITAARREEIYKGSATDEAPDILLVLKEGYIATNHYSYTGRYLCPPASIATTKTGDHRPEGVFIASGDGIRDTGEVSSLSVCDITPAILQLMDIPYPDYMDGELRQDVLTNDVFATDGSPVAGEKVQLKTRIRNLKRRGLK